MKNEIKYTLHDQESNKAVCELITMEPKQFSLDEAVKYIKETGIDFILKFVELNK